MKYIVQVFAGSWDHPNYRADEIISKLKKVMEAIPVEKVIIGWTLRTDLYRSISACLRERGVEMFLWLPVFSETDLLLNVDGSKDLWGRAVTAPAIEDGEAFMFACPSSEKNLKNTEKIYSDFYEDCGFDGVFLDRIRTQSFAGGLPGVLSCCCANCRSFYEKRGVDPEKVAKHLHKVGNGFFDAACISDGRVCFQDPLAEAFFTVKSELITSSVIRLCRYFHEKDLKVGLDLFAPLLSTFVGQDYEKICAEADFIKPMLYLRTMAPAGIGYEYDLLKKNLQGAKGYDDLHMDEAFLTSQLRSFANLGCKKFPGIEVNHEKDIVETDPEYIRDCLRIFKENKVDGATLAWDVMMAPDAHLAAIESL